MKRFEEGKKRRYQKRHHPPPVLESKPGGKGPKKEAQKRKGPCQSRKKGSPNTTRSGNPLTAKGEVRGKREEEEKETLLYEFETSGFLFYGKGSVLDD